MPPCACCLLNREAEASGLRTEIFCKRECCELCNEFLFPPIFHFGVLRERWGEERDAFLEMALCMLSLGCFKCRMSCTTAHLSFFSVTSWFSSLITRTYYLFYVHTVNNTIKPSFLHIHWISLCRKKNQHKTHIFQIILSIFHNQTPLKSFALKNEHEWTWWHGQN